MRLDFSTITSGLPLVEYSTKVFDNTILFFSILNNLSIALCLYDIIFMWNNRIR